MKNSLPAQKKILYVITKSNWGGAQRYVYDLATNIDRREFEPVVAMGGDGTLGEMLRHAGIRAVTLDSMQNTTGIRANIARIRELLTLIRTEKPAILHVNSSVAGIVGAIAGRICRTPRIIFTAHGWAFNEDRPWCIRILFKTIHYVTVLLSHHTIAVSHAIIQDMNWPLVAKKMSVINPGRTIGVMFERTEARQKIADFFPAVTPFQTDPWIVCVAELHPIKRHQILFEAVRSLTAIMPQVRLLCFGDGSERATLTRWVQNHGMSEHIFVCGNLHEAARFMQAFDVFALASKSESYGYVIHEAGLAGVPVVASRVGGIPDIITTDDMGILVDTADVTDWANALYATLTNKDESLTRARKLQRHLQDKSVTIMVSATTDCYKARIGQFG